MTHIVTGMLCGSQFYDTVQEAFAFIERLQPHHAAWTSENPGEAARDLYLAARSS